MFQHLRLKLLFIALGTISVSACGPQFVIPSKKVTVTDTTINEKNQVNIPTTSENGNSQFTNIGLLSAEELKATLISKDNRIEVITNLNLKTKKGDVKKIEKIELVGELDENGEAILKPKNSKEHENVRIKALCLNHVGGSCDSAVLDLYVKEDNQYYVTQLEAEFVDKEDSKTKDNGAQSKKEKTTEQESELENPKPGLYINSIYNDPSQIFNDKDVNEKEKDTTIKINSSNRPKNQSIGAPSNGRMENPSSLTEFLKKYKKQGIKLANTQRDRHWGTYELVFILGQIGESLHKIIPNYDISVSDLSKKTGGSLGSAHASHQNGLDADISYLDKNPTANYGFPIALRNDKLSKDFLVKENFNLFSELVKTKFVDRIFVNIKIKQALCKYAQSEEVKKVLQQELVTETLRRTRIEKNHADHFHLRIKCSTSQPRCRTAAEPPAGSSCDKI